MDRTHTTAYPFSLFEDLSDTPYKTGADRRKQPPEAATVWSALAPLMAGRPIVRESRNGGRAYPKRWQRKLSEQLPSVPAAIPVYSSAGDTRMLAIDLDCTARLGGRDAVMRDAQAVRDLVHRAGGQLISDQSPSGGIHLYLLLDRPIAFGDARDMALALAARTPTMDPRPMQGLTDGLIRPPGARHKSGGFQELHGSLARAHRLAIERNSREVWKALTAQLAEELQAIRGQRRDRDTTNTPAELAEAPYLPRAAGPRSLSVTYLQMALTGEFNTARYATPSDARQAVLVSAAHAGMQLIDIATRIESGVWPGLASFYARYKIRDRRRSLIRDWTEAIRFASQQPDKNVRKKLVRISPTSEPTTHARVPGLSLKVRDLNKGSEGEYQHLREWWSALEMLEPDRYRGRTGPAFKLVLRAMGEAAKKIGSRYVDFGTRSLDIATGLDHTTVASHLRTLRDEDDPLIVLVESDRGLQGDLYELRVPDGVSDRAARRSWRGGKIHALRPAFRELGLPAAFVYESLEHARSALTSFDLALATGLARSTVYEALQTLSAYELVEQNGGRWTRVASTSLTMLAEALGCLEVIQGKVQQYRRERNEYRRVLKVVPITEAAGTHTPLWGPVSEAETVMDLLQRVFGARRIA